jgi:hypothetical protein
VPKLSPSKPANPVDPFSQSGKYWRIEFFKAREAEEAQRIQSGRFPSAE